MTNATASYLRFIDCAKFTDVYIPAPQTVLVTDHVTIGADCSLWPGTVLIAEASSPLQIGAATEIGFEGGFTIDARGSGGITIGAGARLLGGGSLTGSNAIGDGAQILGPIRCQRCTLGSGDTYRHSDPDQRGAVLKGCGVARDIAIDRGEVIQAFGLFTEAEVRRQSFFHPPGECAASAGN